VPLAARHSAACGLVVGNPSLGITAALLVTRPKKCCRHAKRDNVLSKRSLQVGHSRCLRARLQCRFENHTSQRAAIMRSWSKQVAWLCLLLTFWSAIALVSHHHRSAVESAKCTVCIAAHSAAPKAATAPSRVTSVSIFILRIESLPAKQSPLAFALSVRPPPPQG
jgi:hypothetical protein